MIVVERGTNHTWNEFANAVEFVEQVEMSGLTVWGALADALGDWLDQGGLARGTDGPQCDPLRQVLRLLLETLPEAGAPGGVRLDAVLEAAMSEWVGSAAVRTNDGLPFVG